MDNRISIREVDERDSRWEAHGPRLRVYLHNGGEHETSGATATYDVTGADILQVIDWAQEQVHGDNMPIQPDRGTNKPAVAKRPPSQAIARCSHATTVGEPRRRRPRQIRIAQL